MSQTQPYIDTEPDGQDPEPPPAPSSRACLLCGFEGTSRTVWQKPAWWREAGPDGKRITTVPRCLDIPACRARVAANGEAWPLVESGENPWAETPPVRPAEPPVELAPKPEPPKEVERVDWI